MKKVLWGLSIIVFYSCASGNYRLSEYEKGKLRGYHANEANRLIDINKKNRKANKKAAEKDRQEQAAKLNELNHRSHDKKNTGKSGKTPYNMY